MKRKPAKSRSSLPPLYSHEELIRRLSAPLPEGAVKDRDDDTGLKDINYQYQVERMNLVFGVGGWKSEPVGKTTCETIATYGGAAIEATATMMLTVKRYGICHVRTASYHNGNKDWAIKGAETSATGKCMQLLGIASDVYKGLLNSGNSNGKSTQLSDKGLKSLFKCAIESAYNDFEAGRNVAEAKERWEQDWERFKEK